MSESAKHKDIALQLSAEKLLNTFKGLEGQFAEQSERRWVWELVQNAYDTAHEQQPRTLSISICLSRDGASPTVTFQHDGPPFELEHLNALVWQATTKDEEEGDDGVTGRFGSGFITTYLLSKRVTIGGRVVSGPVGLPFTLEIRRDTVNKKEMERFLAEGDEKVERLREALASAPPSDEVEPTTTFTYALNERGVAIAKTGTTDLLLCAAYLLAFNDRLRRVELRGLGVDYDISATKGARAGQVGVSISRSDDADVYVRVLSITEAQAGPEGTPMSISLAVGLDPEPSLMPGTGGGLSVRELGPDAPRLFRRFPLVGSEVLNLPFVLESTYFEPTEPRTGLELKGDGDTVRHLVQQNKTLLLAVPGLYEDVLGKARDEGWKEVWRLLLLPDPAPAPWLDEGWYAEHVLGPLRRTATSLPVVPTVEGGVVPLGGEGGAVIPAEDDDETLWGLLSRTPLAARLPPKADLGTWRHVRSKLGAAEGVPPVYGARQLVQKVAGNGDVEWLAGWLGTTTAEALSWLHELVRYLEGGEEKDRKLLAGVRWVAGKREVHDPILPNQKGDFRPLHALVIDEGDVPEPLKDIADALDLGVRERLLDKAIMLTSEAKMNAKKLAGEIEEAVGALDAPSRDDRTDEAFGRLFAWILENREDADAWFSAGFLGSAYRTLRRDSEHLASYQAQQELARIEERVREAGFGSTEELLAAFETLKSSGAAGETAPDQPQEDDPFGTHAREIAAKAVDLWAVIRQALLNEGGTLEVMARRDLAWWRESYPGLFEHVQTNALEKYFEWLVLLEEAKREVKAKLDADPSYDVEEAEWRGDDDFPSIIPGVFRIIPTPSGDVRERPNGDVRERVDFVVRPAHGGGVILYWKEERKLLQRPRAELWAAGGGYRPRPITIGGLAESLGIRRIPLLKEEVPAQESTN